TLPDRVDAGRMVAARREFRGSLPVSSLCRLVEAAGDDRGEVAYELEFGRESPDVPYLALRARVRLGLECHGTLQPARVIEDELLLALPAFPVKPGSEAETEAGGEAVQDAPPREDNPFAL